MFYAKHRFVYNIDDSHHTSLFISCQVSYFTKITKKFSNDVSKMLKAISDPKRLRIVDMLSCGELCACVILESFRITQPTLSHDMKVLTEAGIVLDRREGKNTFYSLNRPALDQMLTSLGTMFQPKADCICHRSAE